MTNAEAALNRELVRDAGEGAKVTIASFPVENRLMCSYC